ETLHRQGAQAVLIKGGHLQGAATDLLYWQDRFYTFESARIEGGAAHGTGCALSSAIAALLARGNTVEQAVAEAKRFTSAAIAGAEQLGKGASLLHHFYQGKEKG